MAGQSVSSSRLRAALRSPAVSLVVVVVVMLLLLLDSSSGAQAQDSPPEAAIESFVYRGSGCPANSAVGEISKDGQVLTLKFSEFSASTDSGMSGIRKNCQVNLKMRYPAGWVYALDTITLRGYARLDAEAKAIHKVQYYFTGERGTGSFSGQTVGEHDANYEHSGPFSPLIKSKCNLNRNLNINMEVRVDNSANKEGQGFIDVDTADTTVVFHCKWTQCAS